MAAASSSSASRKIRISDEAYLMIGLHASKYPENPVLGYLIGSEANDQFDVSDIFPVSHSVPAGPILEISAELAERSVAQTSKKVLGFYYGLEYTSTMVPAYIERIAANLKNILGAQAIALQFKNNLLGTSKSLFVEGSLVTGSAVKTESVSLVTDVNQHFTDSITHQRHLLLCDFEEHMNCDSFGDYFNKELVASLKIR
eukprot:gene14360-10259_t